MIIFIVSCLELLYCEMGNYAKVIHTYIHTYQTGKNLHYRSILSVYTYLYINFGVEVKMPV